MKVLAFALSSIPVVMSTFPVQAQNIPIPPQYIEPLYKCITFDCASKAARGIDSAYQYFRQNEPKMRQNMQRYQQRSMENPFQPRYNNCLTVANCQNSRLLVAPR